VVLKWFMQASVIDELDPKPGLLDQSRRVDPRRSLHRSCTNRLSSGTSAAKRLRMYYSSGHYCPERLGIKFKGLSYFYDAAIGHRSDDGREVTPLLRTSIYHPALFTLTCMYQVRYC
jgi:hypothetical protein